MTAIDTNTEAVERLMDGVTPGPWLVGEDQCVDDTWSIVTTSGGAILANVNDRPARTANARFIAAARDLVPALLKERDEASARIEALEAFLAEFAEAKFPALPKPHVSHPADEPDPATDAEIVWAWQEDARELLKGEA